MARHSAASASSTSRGGSSPAAPVPTSSSPSTRKASAEGSRTATRSPASWIGSRPRRPERRPSGIDESVGPLEATALAAERRDGVVGNQGDFGTADSSHPYRQ